MNDKEILELIRKNTIKANGKEKFTCKAAWDLASKHDIPLKKIGELCDSNSIKICDCSLGCF
ncbi:MAG: hypothetical protein WCR55_01490 [Lentisphaerota bacterium]